MTIIKAQAGNQVAWPIDGKHQTFTVKKPCGRTFGRWCCVTCGETFAGARERDTHLRKDAQHVLVWKCHSGHFEFEEVA